MRRLVWADFLHDGEQITVNGALLLEDERIAAVEDLATLGRRHPDVPPEHLGAAISPRVTNAHTHLDMSRHPFQRLPYFDWITGAVVPYQARRDASAAREGLARLEASGAIGVGDIVYHPDVMATLLEQSALGGIAYWEVFAPDPDRAEAVFAQTVARITAWRKLERPGGMRVGLTPHTPFTVSSRLLRLLGVYARQEGLPVQIHVAEHDSELELFRTASGPLTATMLALHGVPVARTLGRAADPALTPVNHLAELGVLAARPTLVHGVHVTENDVRTLAQFGCAVVTCPRSNRHLSCGEFPWALYRRHGITVGLGTDSVASGESLEVSAELTASLAWQDAPGVPEVLEWALAGNAAILHRPKARVTPGSPFTAVQVWKGTP